MVIEVKYYMCKTTHLLTQKELTAFGKDGWRLGGVPMTTEVTPTYHYIFWKEVIK